MYDDRGAPGDAFLRNFERERPMCGTGFLKLLGPRQNPRRKSPRKKGLFGRKKGRNSKYEEVGLDLSPANTLFVAENEMSCGETSSESSFKGSSGHGSIIPQFSPQGVVNYGGVEYEGHQYEYEDDSDEHPTDRPATPKLSNVGNTTFEHSFPSADDQFQSEVGRPHGEILPSVAEVVTEDYASISQMDSESTISSMDSSAGIDKPERVLVAMRDMILQQQENLQSLADKNKKYRERLEQSQDRILNMRKDHLDQGDVIKKLQFERESFEAEAVWLREELKTIKHELTNLAQQKEQEKQKQESLAKSRSVSVLDRAESPRLATSVATSEVRWTRNQSFVIHRPKNEEDNGCVPTNLDALILETPSSDISFDRHHTFSPPCQALLDTDDLPNELSIQDVATGTELLVEDILEEQFGRHGTPLNSPCFFFDAKVHGVAFSPTTISEEGSLSHLSYSVESTLGLEERGESDVTKLRPSTPTMEQRPASPMKPSRQQANQVQRPRTPEQSPPSPRTDLSKPILLSRSTSAPERSNTETLRDRLAKYVARTESTAFLRQRLYERARQRLQQNMEPSDTSPEVPSDLKWARAQNAVIKMIRDDLRMHAPNLVSEVNPADPPSQAKEQLNSRITNLRKQVVKMDVNVQEQEETREQREQRRGTMDGTREHVREEEEEARYQSSRRVTFKKQVKGSWESI